MANRVWFWNLIAKRYAKSPVADEASYEKKLELTRECFASTSRVLELGSGTGTTAVRQADAVASYLGVDISTRMVEIARQRARAAGRENLRFIVGDLSAVDGSSRFDAILAMSVLHLLPNRTATIADIYDRLEDGGVFVSSTVCLANASIWLRWFGGLAGTLGVIPRVWLLSPEALTREIRAAGFDIETEWQPNAGPALFLIARKADQAPG